MKDKQEKIRFHYLYKDFYFPNRTEVKNFLLRLFAKEGKRVEAINYIFCDDAYLVQINQQYLQHDTLTDIITFELSPKTQPLTADIYISVERVKENAGLYNNTFRMELMTVICHGALHLAGYKDKTASDVRTMRVKEQEYLQLFEVSRDTVSKRNI